MTNFYSREKTNLRHSLEIVGINQLTEWHINFTQKKMMLNKA